MDNKVSEQMTDEEAKKILEDMDEKADLSLLEEMVKDNKIEFEQEGVNYRVRLLNIKEKEELDNARRKKFGQLIKDSDILLEKDLIRIYKDRGIDLEEINTKVKKLQAEELNYQLKLGEAVGTNSDPIILNKYKKDIVAIRVEINVLLIQKATLLEYSLENQLANYVAGMLTYLSLEKENNNSWIRAFETYDKFAENLNNTLILKAAKYALLLQHV